LTEGATFDFNISKSQNDSASKRLEFSMQYTGYEGNRVSEFAAVQRSILNRVLDRKTVHGIFKTRQVDSISLEHVHRFAYTFTTHNLTAGS
jgi:hypothetical protein